MYVTCKSTCTGSLYWVSLRVATVAIMLPHTQVYIIIWYQYYGIPNIKVYLKHQPLGHNLYH